MSANSTSASTPSILNQSDGAFGSFNISSSVLRQRSGDRYRNLFAMAAFAWISAGWSLAISEHGLLRMPFGKRSRSGGIAEVLGPLPVPDLRHIFQVFADIVVVAL